jgi:gamma-glutamylcyclotransferase (GGCT)/AIG2-like uncharacterized protein YtfP
MTGSGRSPRLLFVYGTLRPGAAPAPLGEALGRARRLGGGQLPGRLYDLGPYPAAVPDAESGTIVRGEVLELPPDPGLLARLDAYEGREYERVERCVQLDSGRTLRCWMYAYTGEPGPAPLVENGTYRPRRPYTVR